jgi:type II secretory pathway pseudopilin PulG
MGKTQIFYINNHGFTLDQLITATAIMGILSAIAVPSLNGMFRRQTIEQAVAVVEATMREAQRQAMRNSTSCNVVFGTDTVATACADGSINRTETLPENVTMTNTFTVPAANTAQFSFRGTVSGLGAVQLAMAGSTSRCVNVGTIIGAIRNGTVNGGNCIV